MTMTRVARLREMTVKDIDLVLTWRNHPSIRAVMKSQHIISSQEHFKWFTHNASNPDKKLLIFEVDNVASGFVQFTDLSKANDAVYWGFYLAPEAKSGSGKILGKLALKFVFENTEKKMVIGQALDTNEASIRFHCRLGFIKNSTNNSHVIEGSERQLIYFSISKDEYLRKNYEAYVNKN